LREEKETQCEPKKAQWNRGEKNAKWMCQGKGYGKYLPGTTASIPEITERDEKGAKRTTRFRTALKKNKSPEVA